MTRAACFLAGALLFVFHAVCFAQRPLEVSVFLDKTSVMLGEVVEFTITIEGIDSAYGKPRVVAPDFGDYFTVIASFESNNIEATGIYRQTQVSWQLRYKLIPKQIGTIIIEPAKIFYLGQTYTTQELLLYVKLVPRQKRISSEAVPSEGAPEEETETEAPSADSPHTGEKDSPSGKQNVI